ncbi:Hypothetical protein D9617_43g040410 [Elsinoe fawcettii]|nr:Hypothetical protein D9617_43g040410 [Elsinoe fawcettii]
MPLVANGLANQLGGAAARSELDAVAKVLRSLMTDAGPLAKGLLETALQGNAFPTEAWQRVQDKDMRMSVQKIVMLRGGRWAARAVGGGRWTFAGSFGHFAEGQSALSDGDCCGQKQCCADAMALACFFAGKLDEDRETSEEWL